MLGELLPTKNKRLCKHFSKDTPTTDGVSYEDLREVFYISEVTRQVYNGTTVGRVYRDFGGSDPEAPTVKWKPCEYLHKMNVKLHSAVLNGNARLVSKYVALGADLNSQLVIMSGFSSSYRVTPLQRAARHNNIGVARRLIEEGAGINFSDYLGRTPLFIAVLCRNLPMVHLLVQAGANTEQKASFFCMGAPNEPVSPLEVAIRLHFPEAVTKLMK
jgi:hypothetical protein